MPDWTLSKVLISPADWKFLSWAFRDDDQDVKVIQDQTVPAGTVRLIGTDGSEAELEVSLES